jgi:hypothetical protein
MRKNVVFSLCRSTIGWLLLTFPLIPFAQDIESLSKQKIVKVNGGLSANTTFYSANGIDNRRDPFYWQLNANLNLNFLGIIQAPFSMTLSEQQKKFAQPQPFNRFGISPIYKSVTAHFGHRSMQFSEYTLSGNMFLGAGVEVSAPESAMRISVMCGRLARAVQRAAQQGMVFANPGYRRMGYGAKIGFGRKKNLVDLIFFKAKDDDSSVDPSEELKVKPEENLVGAIHSKHLLSEKVILEYEYAYSLLTRDTRATEDVPANYSFFNNLSGVFKPNISSEFNKAFTGNIAYNGPWYQANFKYRKIDPGYRTLGAPFLNNGLKDVTGGLSWSMLKQKITLSANAGLQENNEERKVIRNIYSINGNYEASEKLSFAASFSNFSTTTRQSQLQTNILSDTLEYYQVTRSASANVNYKLGNDNNAAMIGLTANYQDATNNNKTDSRLYNYSIGLQRKVSEWQIAVSATLNENFVSESHNRSAGPVGNISRSFSKGKFRSGFSAAILHSYIDNTLQSQVINASLTNSFKLFKRNTFALSFYYLDNTSKSENQKKFNEKRVMLNYSFSF